MTKQMLSNIKRTVIPNGEKERVRFEIVCKSCDSDFIITGKPHEIIMESTVFNQAHTYRMHAFFPDIYEIIPTGESLDSLVNDSFNPDHHAHYKRKQEFERIISELRTENSGVAFKELKSNAARNRENMTIYGMKLIAARSAYSVIDVKDYLPIIAVLSDSKTDEFRHFNSFSIKTEDGVIKITSKSIGNLGSQNENLFWNQTIVPHKSVYSRKAHNHVYS